MLSGITFIQLQLSLDLTSRILQKENTHPPTNRITQLNIALLFWVGGNNFLFKLSVKYTNRLAEGKCFINVRYE